MSLGKNGTGQMPKTATWLSGGWPDGDVSDPFIQSRNYIHQIFAMKQAN